MIYSIIPVLIKSISVLIELRPCICPVFSLFGHALHLFTFLIGLFAVLKVTCLVTNNDNNKCMSFINFQVCT